MKDILCYGDSNTWGFHPLTRERYEREERWTGVLQNTLGSEYHVIEEGLNGRTTVWDDPVGGYRVAGNGLVPDIALNGKAYLVPCLQSHKPLDLVIIMLGTNDLKRRFSLSAYDIAQGASILVDVVNKSKCGRGGRPPKVLLLAPPPLGKVTGYRAKLFKGGVEKSKRLSRQYMDVAKEHGAEFLNTPKVTHPSDVDGIHLEKKDHEALGRAVAEIVKRILEI